MLIWETPPEHAALASESTFFSFPVGWWGFQPLDQKVLLPVHFVSGCIKEEVGSAGLQQGFPGGSDGKATACSAVDVGSIPG